MGCLEIEHGRGDSRSADRGTTQRNSARPPPFALRAPTPPESRCLCMRRTDRRGVGRAARDLRCKRSAVWPVIGLKDAANRLTRLSAGSAEHRQRSGMVLDGRTRDISGENRRPLQAKLFEAALSTANHIDHQMTKESRPPGVCRVLCGPDLVPQDGGKLITKKKKPAPAHPPLAASRHKLERRRTACKHLGDHRRQAAVLSDGSISFCPGVRICRPKICQARKICR